MHLTLVVFLTNLLRGTLSADPLGISGLVCHRRKTIDVPKVYEITANAYLVFPVPNPTSVPALLRADDRGNAGRRPRFFTRAEPEQ